MSALGEMIRTFRGIRGLSLQGVADVAGISKTHIWELEQGRNSNPTIETVARVATAIGADPAMLCAAALADCRALTAPTASMAKSCAALGSADKDDR